MESPSIVISFFAGLTSFLSPCVTPLIPAYLTNISGVRISETNGIPVQRSARLLVLKNTLAFIFGFFIIFTLAGVSLGYLSSLGADYSTWLNRIGGAVIIVLSFQFLGLIQIPFLGRSVVIGIPTNYDSGPIRSALLGISFGISFSPCTGPVLGAILALTATSGSIPQGALLMSSFSAGLALPFLIVGIFTMTASRWLSRASVLMQRVQILSGLILLGLGVMVFTGRLQGLIGLFSNLFLSS